MLEESRPEVPSRVQATRIVVTQFLVVNVPYILFDYLPVDKESNLYRLHPCGAKSASLHEINNQGNIRLPNAKSLSCRLLGLDAWISV